MKYYLGIDGGGTKTEFAVSTVDGHVLRDFKRDGSNPNDIGFALYTQNLLKQIIKYF